MTNLTPYITATEAAKKVEQQAIAAAEIKIPVYYTAVISSK